MTGMHRLGSHCTEQQIGQVRSLCCYDHRLEKIIRSCAVLTLLKEITNELFNKISIKKRLNTGGVQQSENRLDLDFGFAPEQVVDIFLGMLGLSNEPFIKKLIEFSNKIMSFVRADTYITAPLPSNCSNQSNLNRYSAQKEKKKEYQQNCSKRIRWTQEDDTILDRYIYLHFESELFNLYGSYSTNTVEKRIKARKEAIHNRLESNEICVIDRHIFHKVFEMEDYIKSTCLSQSFLLKEIYTF